ncbi:SCP2 sterol-binding domain-containing protein [Micromonospora sp. CPCC 205371]|nr:SCP2 sterol-binding domain-containing protein [Micromonospora sp. CPCC 205371]
MTSVVNERFEQIRKTVDSTPAKKLTETLIGQGLTSAEILEAMFAMYRESFSAERARGEHGKFEFCISTPDGPISYALTVDDGTCAIGPGTSPDATSVISMSLSDFLRLSLGKANGAMLAMTGRIKVKGDTVAAMSIRDWFPTE